MAQPTPSRPQRPTQALRPAAGSAAEPEAAPAPSATTAATPAAITPAQLLSIQRLAGNQAALQALKLGGPPPGAAPAQAPAVQRRVDFITPDVGTQGQLAKGMTDTLWVETDQERDITFKLAPEEDTNATLAKNGEYGATLTAPYREGYTRYTVGVKGHTEGGNLRVTAQQGASDARTAPFTVGEELDESAVQGAKTQLVEDETDARSLMVGPDTLTTMPMEADLQPKLQVLEVVQSAGTGELADLAGENVQFDWQDYGAGIGDSHQSSNAFLHTGNHLPDDNGTMTTQQVHLGRVARAGGGYTDPMVIPNSGFEIKRTLEVDQDAEKATLTTTKEGKAATADGHDATAGSGSIRSVVEWQPRDED